MDPQPPTDGVAKPLILFVDDDKDYLEMRQVALRKDYDVHLALSGEEGLLLAKELKPAVMILDMMMPRVSGVEVLGKMMLDPDLQSIPVIVMTGVSFNQAEKWTFQTGANISRFLEKTSSISQLREEIKNALLGIPPKNP